MEHRRQQSSLRDSDSTDRDIEMKRAAFRLGTVLRRNMSTTAEDLLVGRKDNLVTIELNRPKALNALNLDMCNGIKALLVDEINAEDSKIATFVVKGAGGKAFCAGGDVRAIYNELNECSRNSVPIGTGKPGFLHTDFFRHEYIMNYLLGTSKKPQVSLWDGIVMGGGVGVSVLGEFRVATEKSLFAMPETAIGLFPDVGSSAWLPHLEDGYGNYIGLTGCRMNAADLLHTGIATHFVNSDQLSELENALVGLPEDPAESRKSIKSILDKFQSVSNRPDPSASAIAQNTDSINKCFGESVRTIEDVLIALQKESAAGNAWATKSLELLNKMSPSSLKITMEQLKRGKDLDLQGCLKMEFRIIMRCMQGNDFREGIRALLIDKDNQPSWKPAALEQITDEQVESYFHNLGEHELNVF